MDPHIRLGSSLAVILIVAYILIEIAIHISGIAALAVLGIIVLAMIFIYNKNRQKIDELGPTKR